MAEDPYAQTAAVTKTLVEALKQVQETSDLSGVLGPANTAESLSELHVRLVTVRARQSRLSELVASLVMLHSRVKKAQADRRGDLLEAEAAVVSEKKAKVFSEDFSSAQERNAKLASQTLEQRVALRAIDKLVIDTDAALEYARIRHRELGSQVQDVNTRLRIISMESSWDLSS